MMGRPSLRTPEIEAEIISRLSAGEPLAQICRDGHMPSTDTAREWQRQDEAFSRAIAGAREDGFDVIAADLLNIADDGSRDYKPSYDREGNATGDYVPDFDHINRSKLRVETRLKLLSKWDPKRYGERVELRHGDPNGNALAPATISLTIAKAPEDV
jgi:hypothetical protein